MPISCTNRTSGGKGNVGQFIERDPRICAAGVPSQQPNEKVADALNHYLMQEEVDALISDAIIPPKEPKPLPPLRKPMPIDMRFAGPQNQVANIIKAPRLSKLAQIAEDLKSTAYASYWKRDVGKRQDYIPFVPQDFDPDGTTFGRKVERKGRLYDVALMPLDPVPDRTPASKEPGYQICRNYCGFSKNLTYGRRLGLNPEGVYMKCMMTDPRVDIGTANKTIINDIKHNYDEVTKPAIGSVLSPNNNIKEFPEGWAFGKPSVDSRLTDCIYSCKLRTDREIIKKCIAHLNSLRKSLKPRSTGSFFQHFYLDLKHFDKEKSGCLPKDFVYNEFKKRYIYFNKELIETLMSVWKIYDGQRINYKSLLDILNPTQNMPDLPKILDFDPDCLDFNTTYSDAFNHRHKPDHSPMAGVPSGRYLFADQPKVPQKMCRAYLVDFPQETNIQTCLSPSVLTLNGVTHRDMYAERKPEVVRRVFEAGRDKFTDERFGTLWEEAKKLHPKGLVCYHTFKKVLEADEGNL